MRRLISALLVLLVVGGIAPTVATATSMQQSPDCAGWLSGGALHHELSPWTLDGLASPAYRGMAGYAVVVGFTVAACGGRWMFAKFIDGKLVTNFFTTRGYIVSQIAKTTPVAKAVVRGIARAIRAAAVIVAAAPTIVLPVVVSGPEALCKQNAKLCPPGTAVVD